MRHATVFAALSLLGAAVFAQNTGQNSPKSAPELTSSLPKQEQSGRVPEGRRSERIRVEDSRATIDETRLGGETQAITVQPRGSALPAYEVLPKNAGRAAPGNAPDTAAGQGPRVWKFLNF